MRGPRVACTDGEMGLHRTWRFRLRKPGLGRAGRPLLVVVCVGLAVAPPGHDALAASASSSLPPRSAVRLVQVWVELELPPLADSGAGSGAHAAASAIEADLVRRMKSLGAVELGRVRVLRRAIAVEVPADRVDALRALAGVRRVTPVRHVDRPPPKTSR